MDELIKKYQYIVDIIINKCFPNKCGDEDYKQIGLIALWKAAQLYDETHNTKFETFASNIIKRTLVSQLRKETAQRNYLNVAENVISIDKYRNEFEENNSYGMHDYIKGSDDINYVDIKGFIKSLDDCEIQIIHLKQKRKSDTQIKETLNLSRRKYEQSLNSAKEKLKKNVL